MARDTPVAAAYGATIGKYHDTMYPLVDLPDMVECIKQVAAPPKKVIDFGAGSGRLALALTEQGYTAHAVDLSAEMLERLRTADLSGSVTRHHCDITTVDAGNDFDVVVITNSTLFMLPTPEQQRQALARAAAHLSRDGRLLVEVYEPSFYHQLSRPHTQSSVLPDGTLVVDSVTNDPVQQLVVMLRTFVSHGVTETFPEVSRYTWPGELDLMAELEGLRLVERWSDWAKTPFDRSAVRHVSLYRLGPQAG
ncbi:class I SAM-dependent methyltransferase [Streptomyces sp. NPDC001219]